MGNVWGIAEPTPLPAVFTPAADVACAAGTETTVITTGALSTPNPGNYYPRLYLSLAILLGAVAPTALVIAFRLGIFVDVDSYTVAPALLVAASTLYPSVTLVGLNSGSIWITPGSTINITVTATAQAVTCKQVGSRALVGLFRGPDV